MQPIEASRPSKTAHDLASRPAPARHDAVDEGSRKAPIHEPTSVRRAEPAGNAAPDAATHRVQPGDTVQAIAARYDTTPARLFELNPNLDPAHHRYVPAQATDHWAPEYLQNVDAVRIPDSSKGSAILALQATGSVSQAEAVDEALATVENSGTPFSQVEELEAQAAALRSSHGEAAAQELVARYIQSHPDTFAEGYTLRDAFHEIDDAERSTFAAGLDQAHSNTATSPYHGPAVLASRLAEGGLRAYQELAEIGHGYQPASSGISGLVAETGNDRLQTQFVTSGLYRAKNVIDRPAPPPGDLSYATGYDYETYGAGDFLASLGGATEGSSQAAAAVINFAHANSLAHHARGVESLRTILYTFSQDRASDGQSYLTFLEAAVPADLQLYGSMTAPQRPLTDEQSMTLFLAISGASTDRTGLIEIDDANGNPLATELTARLFQNYYDRWIDPQRLNIAGDGTFGMGSGRYEGINVQAAFQNFFQEAMIDREEAGAYRDGLTRFVVDRVFQGYDAGSDMARLWGSPTLAAAHSGTLLRLMGLAELDVLKDLADASAADKRLLTLAVGAFAAIPGAFTGGIPGAVTTSKVGQALMSYFIGKANGSIQSSLVDYLAASGVDAEAAQQINNYVANGDPAALRGLLTGMLEGSNLPQDVIEPFMAEFLSTLTLPADQGGGFANALEAAMETLDNRPQALSEEQLQHIRDALNQLQQALS
jgi:LysM domain